MKTVRDIMTEDVVTLAENMTLREAIEALSSARVSGAPIVAGTAVVGVASRTDILEFAASSPGIPPRRQQTADFGEVSDGAATFDEDQPAAYFVDWWRDSEANTWSRMSETESPEWDRLDEHSIAEVMSRSIASIGPDASIREAAGKMVDDGFHRLLVMKGGELLGVVSTMDIVRAVAEDEG